jgi:cytochrome c oxidase assembly protein subunit 15
MTLHRFTWLLAAATFLLLLVGALVHGTGSGLACPDWPLCHGTAFPTMTGHVLFEHGHRLVAGTVAALTLGLAIAIPLARPRDGRLIGVGVLAAVLVLVQALLGALTVWLKLPAIVSTAHLAVSMVFFATTLWLVARTRPKDAPVAALAPPERKWIFLTMSAVYLQILLGGLVRHTGSGLACIDFPLCHGSLLPLGEHPSVILQAVHRLFAVVVAVLIVFLTVRLLKARSASSTVTALAVLAPLLVMVQGTLGVLSVLSFLELYRVTAHLGVAALLWATVVGLWLSTRARAGSAA